VPFLNENIEHIFGEGIVVEFAVSIKPLAGPSAGVCAFDRHFRAAGFKADDLAYFENFHFGLSFSYSNKGIKSVSK
tara:strand:- start:219 stop:446 length:228 start_codon:yes stop_codon:yes gene_type:complete